MAALYSINTEVPALGDSLSWDTNQCVCDITTNSAELRVWQDSTHWSEHCVLLQDEWSGCSRNRVHWLPWTLPFRWVRNNPCPCSTYDVWSTCSVFGGIWRESDCQTCASLAAKGVGEQDKAGLVSSIAQDASNLHPAGSNQTPVVAIETDSGWDTEFLYSRHCLQSSELVNKPNWRRVEHPWRKSRQTETNSTQHHCSPTDQIILLWG